MAAERPAPRAALTGRFVQATVFARGFRIFFLAASLYASFGAAYWSAAWHGGLPAARWLWPSAWHAHEMLFGVVAAAVAGFLLTAVPAWTSTRALEGGRLAALFALWLAGRVVMGFVGLVSEELVAAIDLAFYPALAVLLAQRLLPARQPHNLGLLAVLAALALVNAAVHAAALGAPIPASRALRFAVDLVIVLIVVIGGRITPAFTQNALARRGGAARVVSRLWLDRTAIAAVVALAICDGLAPRTRASGVLAGLAALALAARMAGWQTRRALADPLLASLHAGLAWVVVGLALVATSDLGGFPPPAAGLHALTAGAIGTMLLAVMTRVALGHTGRPLVLPRSAWLCYALVSLGALLRVIAALPDTRPGLLTVSALTWSAAFALYAALYAPILCARRVDGAPG